MPYGNLSVAVKLSTSIGAFRGELAMMMFFIVKLDAESTPILMRLKLKVVVDSEICEILTRIQN